MNDAMSDAVDVIGTVHAQSRRILDVYRADPGHVLEHANKLREVDVSNVEVTAHAIPVFNVFREDEPRSWFSAEEALSNAPQKTNGLFIVTKVVE